MDSLIGIVIRDGQLCQRYIDHNGKERVTPVQEEKAEQSVSERFKDTETVPQDWAPLADTSVLEPLLTRNEHVARSCALEALLVKAFARSSPGTETFDTRGNTAVKELLTELCRIMGGEWSERAKSIR